MMKNRFELLIDFTLIIQAEFFIFLELTARGYFTTFLYLKDMKRLFKLLLLAFLWILIYLFQYELDFIVI